MSVAAKNLVSSFPLDNYELFDRYRRESGRVFLTRTTTSTPQASVPSGSSGRASMVIASVLKSLSEPSSTL